MADNVLVVFHRWRSAGVDHKDFTVTIDGTPTVQSSAHSNSERFDASPRGATNIAATSIFSLWGFMWGKLPKSK